MSAHYWDEALHIACDTVISFYADMYSLEYSGILHMFSYPILVRIITTKTAFFLKTYTLLTSFLLFFKKIKSQICAVYTGNFTKKASIAASLTHVDTIEAALIILRNKKTKKPIIGVKNIIKC